MSYIYQPPRSKTETANPFAMIEADLHTEAARLEQMLADGSLKGELRQRLINVRKALAKFESLKRDSTAP